MSDVPLPTDAQLRAWAREQLRDSRFMQLPADLLRVLIHHVKDATKEDVINEYRELKGITHMENVMHDLRVTIEQCTYVGCDKVRYDYDIPGNHTSGDNIPYQCSVCEESRCEEHSDMVECFQCGDWLCAKCFARYDRACRWHGIN